MVSPKPHKVPSSTRLRPAAPAELSNTCAPVPQKWLPPATSASPAHVAATRENSLACAARLETRAASAACNRASSAAAPFCDLSTAASAAAIALRSAFARASAAGSLSSAARAARQSGEACGRRWRGTAKVREGVEKGCRHVAAAASCGRRAETHLCFGARHGQRRDEDLLRLLQLDHAARQRRHGGRQRRQQCRAQRRRWRIASGALACRGDGDCGGGRGGRGRGRDAGARGRSGAAASGAGVLVVVVVLAVFCSSSSGRFNGRSRDGRGSRVLLGLLLLLLCLCGPGHRLHPEAKCCARDELQAHETKLMQQMLRQREVPKNVVSRARATGNGLGAVHINSVTAFHFFALFRAESTHKRRAETSCANPTSRSFFEAKHLLWRLYT